MVRDLQSKGVVFDKDDAWAFSMWKGYLKRPDHKKVESKFKAAGSSIFETKYHTSGHASQTDMEQFARCVAPRHLVPVHGDQWDQHIGRFENVHRLCDGEPFEIV